MNSALSFKVFFLCCLTIISSSSEAYGPQISIVERDVNFNLIRTLDFKSNPPQKNLTKIVNGHKALDTDPKNSQESAIKKILSDNLFFTEVCNYREYSEFSKKHPEKEDWEISQLFSKYIEDNNIKLKSNEECFAEELDKLIAIHPCLQKNAKIEFQVKPLPTDEELMSRPRHGIYIVGVNLVGCPSSDPDQVLEACSYERKDGQTFGFGPGIWGTLVKTCTEAFKNPEYRKMADATANQVKSHIR